MLLVIYKFSLNYIFRNEVKFSVDRWIIVLNVEE